MTLKFKASNATVGEFTVLEPDLYDAVFTKYELTSGTFGPSVKMFFDADNDGTDVEVSGFCGLPKDGEHLNIKSKLRTWMQAMIGRVLEEGEEADLDALIGSKCRVDLEVTSKPVLSEDGKVVMDDKGKPAERRYNKIVGVKPRRTRGNNSKKDEAPY